MEGEDLIHVTQECEIIINNAASINFTERLDNALRINTLGPYHLIKLAHKCPRIESVCHVSTAYVNCNKPGGFIEEKIYEDLDIDVEKFIDNVFAMPTEEIEKKQLEMLRDFPNTYTFTKNLGERLIRKHRGHIPLVIVRPSIIGVAMNDPEPGWIDSIAAAGAIYLTAGIGILQTVPGNMYQIGDQIPVDYVSNCIIAATAHYGNKDKFTIVHSASSSVNPVTWQMVRRYLYIVGNHYKMKRKIRAQKFKMYKSKTVFETLFFIKETLPIEAFKKTASLVGNA